MVILCPHCKREIDVDHSGNTICHICKHVFDAFIFSPVNKEVVVAAAAAMSIEGKKDAKCYMHPENRADHVCERCGSFICPVCLVEIEKKNLCPKCFDRMEDEGTLKTTKTIFFDWGRLVFGLSILSYLTCYMGVIIAPLTIVFGIYGHYQIKKDPEKRGKGYLIAGIVMASIYILICLGLLTFMIMDKF